MTTTNCSLDGPNQVQSADQTVVADAQSDRAKEHMAIMELAAIIEQDSTWRLQWFVGDPIYSLGDLTAAQLVALGRADQVIMFLSRIIYADRLVKR